MMQPFKLTLENGATLTGLHNTPDKSTPGYTALPDGHRPLFVAIHGGSYSSAYFDADSKHTAALCSNSLGVPVVAIDRPLYRGSTSFYPIPEGSSYHEQLAVWLHNFILPALWAEFGKDKGCSCLVLHCHSLGAPSAVIAAGWYAAEATHQYPLAGITISGYGSKLSPATADTQAAGQPDPEPEFLNFPVESRDEGMLPDGTADPDIYKQSARLNNPFPSAERQHMMTAWFRDDRWRAWAAGVAVPVLIGISELDTLWDGTEEHLREFSGSFTGSPRVDGSFVRGAPHCMELSYWAQGWYARCFGFAMECAVSFASRVPDLEVHNVPLADDLASR